MFYSFSCVFLFIGDKVAVYCFKDEIIPSLKANDRLKFDQDLTINNMREKLNHDSKYHTNYLRNNMYIIHYLKYLRFRH